MIDVGNVLGSVINASGMLDETKLEALYGECIIWTRGSPIADVQISKSQIADVGVGQWAHGRINW